MELSHFYKKRSEQFLEQVKLVRKKLKWLAFLRLLFMLASIFLIFKGIKLNIWILYSSGGLLFLLFFRLVTINKNLSEFKNKLEKLVLINQQELKALQGDFSHFNQGISYLNPEHEFTYDLDIFGNKSLFQYINRTITKQGEKKLADEFISSPKKKSEIVETQYALMELSGNQEIIQEYRATGMLTKDSETDQDEIISWIENQKMDFSVFVKFLVYALGLANSGLLIASIFNSAFSNLLIITVIFSWFFYSFFMTKINRYHSTITKKQAVINKYLNLSEIISKMEFQHKYLTEIQSFSQESIKKLKSLDLLMNFLDTRLNVLVGVVLNTLFLLDFHIIMKMEKWKINYKSGIRDFFASHARFDALASQSIYTFNHPKFNWPKPADNAISAKEMGHPLLHESKRISSDFSVTKKENLIIITGANMAGKSTFLRSVGANLILAGMGLKVCAKEFSFRPEKIITGMRTTDSLAESESYFYAELKRLQRIVQGLEKGESYFILLDEILKGTNSSDKHKGSDALIRQLIKTKAICLIASHDLELGKMQNEFPENVRNYRFESLIDKDELIFDYKLQTGIAQNMNASFLMKKMGIIR